MEETGRGRAIKILTTKRFMTEPVSLLLLLKADSGGLAPYGSTETDIPAFFYDDIMFKCTQSDVGSKNKENQFGDQGVHYQLTSPTCSTPTPVML